MPVTADDVALSVRHAVDALASASAGWDKPAGDPRPDDHQRGHPRLFPPRRCPPRPETADTSAATRHSHQRRRPGARRSPTAPTWRSEALVSQSGSRRTGTTPLRDWDGREHISTARFTKAVAQYRITRRAVLAELRAPGTADQAARLFSLGREYGDAFNHLDRRNPFIETVEREELGRDLVWARERFVDGLESTHDW